MEVTMTFNEVEHDGDLDPILDDIRRSGGRVQSTEINEDAETATVWVEVADSKRFREQFMATPSADYI